MTALSTAPRAFAVWFSQLDRWSVGSFTEVGWRWPSDVIRPLADALSRKVLDVNRKASDPATLRMVTLHFTGEMREREGKGVKPIKGRLWWADPGDVVYSKIDVRNGAIGIVPDELGRVCVTSEYPVYAVNPTVADARYIKLLFRTSVFRRKINSMISGASGRKRVQPADLEGVEVPVPPVSVQRRIVAAWESARKAAAATAARIEQLEREIESRFLADLGLMIPMQRNFPKALAVWFSQVERWGVDFNQQASMRLDPASGTYPVVCLGDVITDLENGWSPKCLDHPARDGQWAVLKMGAVSFGTFDETQNKAIPPKLTPRADLEVKPGDWLISRANITRLVGASALVRQTRPALMLCDKIFRAVWRDPSPIDPAYLDEVVKLPHLRQQIEGAVTGTSATMKNITKPSLLALRLPLPPLSIQRQVVARIAKRRAEIAALKAETKARDDATKVHIEALILGEKPALA